MPAMVMQSGYDILEYRQKLKEKLKEKFRTSEQSGSSSACGRKLFDERPRKDDFGSFFGPSETVIAPRVVEQSSRALLEKTRALKEATCTNSARTNNSSSGGRGEVSQAETLRQIVQMKKENIAFYSSLFSDHGVSVPASVQASSPSQKSNPSSISKKVQAPSPSQRIRNVSSSDDRKSQVSDRNCEQRKPIARTTSRVQCGAADKMPCNSRGVQRAHPPSSKSNLPAPPVTKPPLQQKKKMLEDDDSKRAKLPQKQTSASSSSKPTSSNKSMESKCHHPKKKRPAPRSNDPFLDDQEDEGGVDFRSMIRQMYRYDPNKYRDEDDDVSNMEVGFHTIMKEERRSNKLAKEEDERELRLIEEEERREQLRRKAKKRKLSS